jgi:hypothetical protein
MDLFAEKIKRVPLTTCFPHYNGTNTFEECTRFIADQFQAVNKNTNKLIYTHLSCATDTANINLVSTSSYLLNLAYQNFGIESKDI